MEGKGTKDAIVRKVAIPKFVRVGDVENCVLASVIIV